MKRTLRDAFDRWKDALFDQDKQTTKTARHRAHACVTSMAARTAGPKRPNCGNTRGRH
jgi:hypothetical protein